VETELEATQRLALQVASVASAALRTTVLPQCDAGEMAVRSVGANRASPLGRWAQRTRPRCCRVAQVAIHGGQTMPWGSAQASMELPGREFLAGLLQLLQQDGVCWG